ncbi:hypothetical protein [Roseobacter ponti]|uniref:Uncharacterized protein n=1 Tax=Roseobacter ponti TaxID=1891787 RepID=A0A858SVZ2_9RHOB|nr:hypothetical protein [Roseobacter ponti]QJF52450.1 hypothetical protein G3256_15370 [Roseobacter ponti]
MTSPQRWRRLRDRILRGKTHFLSGNASLLSLHCSKYQMQPFAPGRLTNISGLSLIVRASVFSAAGRPAQALFTMRQKNRHFLNRGRPVIAGNRHSDDSG